MSDKPRALVVDDNAANRLLAGALLKKLGWQIEEAHNGATAVERVAEGQFTLILLDISMPGMSGEEACVAMRALPGGESLRIVAYTAHAFPDEKTRILAAGFDDLVIKPISIQALGAAVSRV